MFWVRELLNEAIEASAREVAHRAPRVMCLVDDHTIPVGKRDLLRASLSPTRVRRRCDHVVVERPGIFAWMRGFEPRDRARVELCERLVELGLELELPLGHNSRRCENKCAARHPASLEFLQNQAGFDRLAEADLVREEEAVGIRRCDT